MNTKKVPQYIQFKQSVLKYSCILHTVNNHNNHVPLLQSRRRVIKYKYTLLQNMNNSYSKQ